MKFNLDIEKVNYLKIVYHDNDGFSHYIKTAIKKLTERDIFACAKIEEDLFIKTPQDVDLSFITDNGVYKTISNLKYIEKEEPYIFFTIQTPQEVDYVQSREYFRVLLNEDVLISYIDNGEIKRVSAKTHDISANGIRIIVDNDINFPKEVLMNILFPKHNVDVKARYVRKDYEDSLIMASFYYLDLEEIDMDFISQVCIKKQIEEKRKNRL